MPTSFALLVLLFTVGALSGVVSMCIGWMAAQNYLGEDPMIRIGGVNLHPESRNLWLFLITPWWGVVSVFVANHFSQPLNFLADVLFGPILVSSILALIALIVLFLRASRGLRGRATRAIFHAADRIYPPQERE